MQDSRICIFIGSSSIVIFTWTHLDPIRWWLTKTIVWLCSSNLVLPTNNQVVFTNYLVMVNEVIKSFELYRIQRLRLIRTPSVPMIYRF